MHQQAICNSYCLANLSTKGKGISCKTKGCLLNATKIYPSLTIDSLDLIVEAHDFILWPLKVGNAKHYKGICLQQGFMEIRHS